VATALDVATASLRKIGVLAAEETPTAAAASDAITALRRMLGQWEAEGIRTGAAVVGVAFATTTTLAVPETHLDAVEWNLALRLAPEYGRPLDPAAAALAAEGKRALLAAYRRVPAMRLESAYEAGSRRGPTINAEDMG
jgi:hypothetical protein